jgi:cyclohexanone monooxygenase
VRTQNAFYEIDMLVVATGYDAVTGPLLRMNITGANGLKLADAWAHGPDSYLGLMVAGFPNLFTITGPSSPGVLANVIFSIDQHVEWIANCLDHLGRTGASMIEPTPEAQKQWHEDAMSTVAGTLRLNDENNWYLGTNIPGKPRAVLVYQGGLKVYRDICDAIAADGYRGFKITQDDTVAA